MEELVREQTHNALTVNTATGEHKVFLQGGFYMSGYSTSRIHEHNYAEIHLVAGGNASFTVENKKIDMPSGSMLVVPRMTFHSCDAKDEETKHCAFQIDCDIKKAERYCLSEAVILDLFDIIKRTAYGDNHSAIAAHIALLCAVFEPNGKLLPQPITDYGFLIFEFFSKNYNENIRLSDLAELLHVSKRQAERLVREHTGHSFREELARTRTRRARELLKMTDMSLCEIAEYTGYRSYAGFWKAMKKFEE